MADWIGGFLTRKTCANNPQTYAHKHNELGTLSPKRHFSKLASLTQELALLAVHTPIMQAYASMPMQEFEQEWCN